jgi:hypothetical protein
VPVANSVASQTTPVKLGTITNLQFAPIAVGTSTAGDFVTFVTATAGIKDIITGKLLGTGTTAIDTSTADEYFQGLTNTNVPSSVDRWSFTDGLNYILASNLATVPNTIRFKEPPATTELQSAVDFAEEEIDVVPVTAINVSKWLNTPAISGAYVTTEFGVVGRDQGVQISSHIQGSTGGVQVTGGLANAAQVVLLGSAENFRGSAANSGWRSPTASRHPRPCLSSARTKSTSPPTAASPSRRRLAPSATSGFATPRLSSPAATW